MALTANNLISRATTILKDAAHVRWPEAELLQWLNDGRREIALLKPNAFVRNVSLQLIAGTKQALPNETTVLVAVTRNLGVNGTTPGPVIRLVRRDTLDSHIPGWHTAKPALTVKHYMYDERNPKVFYVYPPQPTIPTQVEAIYGVVPEDIVATDPLGMDETYATALLNYMLHRAYSKDIEDATAQGAAVGYYNAFTGALTGKNNAEGVSSPNSGTV